MKNLFRKNISANCEYCCFCFNIKKNIILCDKYGAVNFKNNCKKFKYNPLKRVPKLKHKNLEFKKEDFNFN